MSRSQNVSHTNIVYDWWDAIDHMSISFRIEGHFHFRTFWTKCCNILKYGMNLKFGAIAQFFRKIIQLNTVIIWKSTNEYYQKIILKSGLKMDLYLAMRYQQILCDLSAINSGKKAICYCAFFTMTSLDYTKFTITNMIACKEMTITSLLFGSFSVNFIKIIIFT